MFTSPFRGSVPVRSPRSACRGRATAHRTKVKVFQGSVGSSPGLVTLVSLLAMTLFFMLCPSDETLIRK